MSGNASAIHLRDFSGICKMLIYWIEVGSHGGGMVIVALCELSARFTPLLLLIFCSLTVHLSYPGHIRKSYTEGGNRT